MPRFSTNPRASRVAHSSLADTYNVLGYYNYQAPRELYPRATAASMRALELEPALAEAHASLGYTRLFFEWDWDGAASSFKRAIALDPSYAGAHQWYAWCLLVAGRADETITAMKTALELDRLLAQPSIRTCHSPLSFVTAASKCV